MRTHINCLSPTRVIHKPGEIILAAVGNFLEDPAAERKPRPAIVLSSGDCQHLIVGLTTQPKHKTTGMQRPAFPNPTACGLDRSGYLWSPRPTRLSRLDALKHLGWIDHETVKVMASTMKLSSAIFTDLWRAAEKHHPRRDYAISL